MTYIDPQFDPNSGTWFITEPVKCEASTIRELKALLRRLRPKFRPEVRDYYPNGDTPPTVWPKPDGSYKRREKDVKEDGQAASEQAAIERT